MRRYDEPVRVRTADDPTLPDPTDTDSVRPAGEPRSFLWHGRVYEVEAVLDRWVLRLPWWRRALAADGGTWALAPHLLDEHVWRVSAGTRGTRDSGIYDLACGHGHAWRLLRVGD